MLRLLSSGTGNAYCSNECSRIGKTADNMSVLKPLGKTGFGQSLLLLPSGSKGLGLLAKSLQADLPVGRNVGAAKPTCYEVFQDNFQPNKV